MNIQFECKNSYRCWECKENCQIKQLFLLPKDLFFVVLHDSYSTNIGFMMAHGIPMKRAEELQNIRTLTFITSREKFLEKRNNTS